MREITPRQYALPWHVHDPNGQFLFETDSHDQAALYLSLIEGEEAVADGEYSITNMVDEDADPFKVTGYGEPFSYGSRVMRLCTRCSTQGNDVMVPDSALLGHENSHHGNEVRVTWEVDVQASDPRSAAYAALDMQRRPGTTATVFEVNGEEVDLGIATTDAEMSALSAEFDGEAVLRAIAEALLERGDFAPGEVIRALRAMTSGSHPYEVYQFIDEVGADVGSWLDSHPE